MNYIINLLSRARAVVDPTRKQGREIFALAVATPGLLGLLMFVVWMAVPPDDDRIQGDGGLVILSAEGNALRRYRERTSGSYTEHESLDPNAQNASAYSPGLIAAILTAEDRRFYYHPGVDPLALLRAAIQNLSSGRVVSGGSTITQQLVRMMYRRELPENPYLRKIAEHLYAVRLELHASKAEILAAYLNRVPLPGNRTGITAGATYLFGRDPHFLNRDEELALAVLIRRNYSGEAAFRTRFRRLAEAITADVDETIAPEPSEDLVRKIFSRTGTESTAATTRKTSRAMPGNSPHFTDWLRSLHPELTGVVRTELSENLNDTIHEILRDELTAMEKLNARHAAVVVLRVDRVNQQLVLEGLVGSGNYDDPQGGQINGATTRRTAGSTLKPFLYGLAIEEQNLRPYTIVYDNDANVSLGDGALYRPRNYDLNYWGAMTAREALATSRNIPAVKLAEQLGEERVFEFLNTAGFFVSRTGADEAGAGDTTPATEPGQPYAFGPGIALGISGATLLDLTRAFAAFPTGGELYPVYLGETDNGRALTYGVATHLFSERTAHFVTHMLADRSMRRRAFGDRSFLDFPFAVAAKTGTSKDYRDAWTVGFTETYVVGVWVGNFDAKPMKNVSGAYGAGRIFHQIMRGLHRHQRPAFHYPQSWRQVAICRHTGLVAGPGCESYTELIPPEDVTPAQCHGEHEKTSENFDASNSNDGEYTDNSPVARRVLLSPTPGATYYLDPHAPRSIQEIPLRVHDAFAREADLVIDYPKKNGARNSCRPRACPPTLALNAGEHVIRVRRAGVIVDEIEIRVK